MNADELISRIASQHQDAPCFTDALLDQSWSYREIDELSRAAAHDLLSRGISRGDRIALLMDNGIACASLVLGAFRAGVTAIPIHPALHLRDFKYIIAQSRSRALFYSESLSKKVSMLSGAELPALVAGISATHATDIMKAGAPGGGLRGSEANEIALVLYTSGTTARPKGIAVRWEAYIDNGRMFAQAADIKPTHRFYGTFTMPSSPGLFNLLMIPFLSGASVILAPPFDARQALDFWSGPIKHNANAFWLVPTILALLLEVDRGNEGAAYCREHVRMILCGTAPLPVVVRRAFEEKYGVPVHESYGLTETLLLTTNTASHPVKDGSVGRPFAGIQIEIDPEDNVILVKTPYFMAGYLGDDGNVEPLELKNGFLVTGDIGKIDKDGCVFITGRKKDLIIRGGLNISPAAIEEVLLGHEAVAEAAVVGLSQELQGEVVAAIVRLKSEDAWSRVRGELAGLCRKELSRVQQPSHFFSIDTMPRNATSKIMKVQLQQMVRDKLRQPFREIDRDMLRFVPAKDENLAKNVEIWDAFTDRKDLALQYPDENLIRLMSGRYIPVPQPPARVLDHGCGSGNNLLFLAKRGYECVGMEISEKQLTHISVHLENAGVRADLRIIQAVEIPFPDHHFDVIISWNVIHYHATREGVQRLVGEYYRVLRPGGVLILATLSRQSAEFRRCRPVGNGTYRIADASPHDNRQGLEWFVAEDDADLKSLFSQFADVHTGHVHVNLFDNTRVHACDLVNARR